MFRKFVFPVLVILAMILSACGGAATPAPAPAAEAKATEAPKVEEAAPTEAPAAEAAPTEAPKEEAAPTEAPKEEAPAAAGQYKESPMLTELVSAGKLPPIEERLPEEPFVVGPGTLIAEKDLPDWQPGAFGGTLNFAHAVANWNPDIFIMDNDNLLCAPGIGLEGLEPCIVKEYKVENENKEFTFTLRKGLKWSDGEPVTTEDVRFVLEDIYGDEKLTPSYPAKYRDGGQASGEPAKLQIIDDYTWKLSFNVPYGGLLRELSIKGWQGYTDMLRPSHVLKQWHAKYADITTDAYKEELTKLNLKDEWWQVFQAKNCNNWDLTNPKCSGYPVLYAWVNTTPAGQSNLLTFERNPYYWKVDNTGQQLPYIDYLKSQQVNDVEMLTLKVLAGEVDFVRESTGLNKLPLYKENEEKAGINITLMDNHVDPTALFFNMTYKDDNWRTVVNDIRFRQAVTQGINRQEIIDTVYFGFAQPVTLVPGEFDAAKANALLDEMGMTKNADGLRQGPDGKVFTILFEHGAHAPDIAQVADLVATQLKNNLGLDVQVKQLEASLWGTRQAANELQMTCIWDVQPMWGDGTWTDYTLGNLVAPLWETYRTSGGKEGEEPSADVKELWRLAEVRNASVPYSDEDKAAYESIRQILFNNVWIMPIAEKVNYALITSKKLGNVPQSGQAIGADYSGEQFFFKK
jgi:peptide/nickel transport system substrate-binding protein